MITTILQIIALAILGLGIAAIPGFKKIGDQIYGIAVLFFFCILAVLIVGIAKFF